MEAGLWVAQAPWSVLLGHEPMGVPRSHTDRKLRTLLRSAIILSVMRIPTAKFVATSVAALLLSIVPVVMAQEPVALLTEIDQALQEQQTAERQALVAELQSEPERWRVYLYVPELRLSSVELRLQRGESEPGQAQFFQSAEDPAWWVLYRDMPAPGDYQLHLHLVSDDDGEVMEQSASVRLDEEVTLIQLELDWSLLGETKLDLIRWTEAQRGWLRKSWNWLWPLGTSTRTLRTVQSDRPDILHALRQCTGGQLRGLAQLQLSLAGAERVPAPLQSLALECALALDDRRLAWEWLQSWYPDAKADSDLAVPLLRWAQRETGYGAHPRALSLLRYVRAGSVPAAISLNWRELMSRLLWEAGDKSEAVAILAEGSQRDANESIIGDAQGQYLRQVMSFNLGVARTLEGDTEQGLALLDEVGRVRPQSRAAAALNDRANVLLGWHFLDQRQGATALSIFERVRQNGRDTSMALLGHGYALLLPAGEVQLRETETESLRLKPGEGLSSLRAKYQQGFISCAQLRDASGDPGICNESRSFEQKYKRIADADREPSAIASWAMVNQVKGARSVGAELATIEARVQAGTLLLDQGKEREGGRFLRRTMEDINRMRAAYRNDTRWLKEASLVDVLQKADPGTAAFWAKLPVSSGGKAVMAQWLGEARTQILLRCSRRVARAGLSQYRAPLDAMLQAELAERWQIEIQRMERVEPDVRFGLARLLHKEATIKAFGER